MFGDRRLSLERPVIEAGLGRLREQGRKTAVDFQLHDLPAHGQAVIAVGGLTAGMEYPVGRLAVLTEGQSILGKKRKSKPVTNRQKLDSYADLSPGDLVVHEHHGVGRFLEMTKMTVDGVEKDYVKIAYAGADVLYVPATQLDLVSKYIGSGEDAKRSSPSWGVPTGRRPRPGPKRRSRIWPRASSSSTPSGSGSPASPSPPTPPG